LFVLAFAELVYGAFANILIAAFGVLTLSVFVLTYQIVERLDSMINHLKTIDLITRDREEASILSDIKHILVDIKSRQEAIAEEGGK